VGAELDVALVKRLDLRLVKAADGADETSTRGASAS
jgi:hypothetical protein